MSIIDEMVKKAKVAQKQWAKADQEHTDKVVREIAKTVADNSKELAQMTVDECGMGNYEYNYKQDLRKSAIIWYELKGKKSKGIIERDEEKGLVTIAKPIGVVGAALPVTIPVTNFMSNCMFSLKSGNAYICAPHPRSVKTTIRTVELVLDALSKFNIPDNLIQCIETPSIDSTKEMMSKVDVVVATGGMGVVKAAYSSGKPAFGVGPGNVQCLVDKGMDIDDVAGKVIEGRVFNNGLPCACEQTAIVHESEADEYVKAFKDKGCVYIDDKDELVRLMNVLFDQDGKLARDPVGKTAYETAKMADINIPEDTKVLLLKGNMEPGMVNLRKEKLCPVTLFYTYDKFENAVEIAKANIELDGKGHSCVIHSDDEKKIEQFAMEMDVSRIIVNACATTSAGGGFLNSFGATTTLGTGFWGNNILNGNLGYRQLMNTTRIGYKPKGARIPSDEEIWAE
jgi:succinate-semialdehyde dehydrogenase